MFQTTNQLSFVFQTYSAYMSRGLLIKQATHIHPLISGDWWAQNISPVALQLINVDIWAQHF